MVYDFMKAVIERSRRKEENNLFGFGSRDVGIDLGTANTLVFIKGKGIVLREPSVVAKNTHTGEIVAVGSAAKNMIGRTPGSIVATRPMKDGVIADFEITTAMIEHYMKEAMKTSGGALEKAERHDLCSLRHYIR